jgi:hypothetical protein
MKHDDEKFVSLNDIKKYFESGIEFGGIFDGKSVIEICTDLERRNPRDLISDKNTEIVILGEDVKINAEDLEKELNNVKEILDVIVCANPDLKNYIESISSQLRIFVSKLNGHMGKIFVV